MESKIKKLVELGCEIILNENDKEEDYTVIKYTQPQFTYGYHQSSLYLLKPDMELVIGSKMRVDAIEKLIDEKIEDIETYNKDMEIKKQSEGVINIIKEYI